MTTMTIDHSQPRFGPLNFDLPYSGPHFTDPWASSTTGSGHQAGSQHHNLYVNNQNSTGLPHLNLSAIPKHPQDTPQQSPHHPPQHHGSRANSTASMAPYSPLSVAAPPAGSPPMHGMYRHHSLVPMSQDLLSLNRLQHPTTSAGYETPAYATAPSPVSPTYTTSSAYDHMSYGPAQIRGSFSLGPEDTARRYSQQSVASSLMDLHSPSGDGTGRGPRISLSDYDRRNLQPDDRRSFQEALGASQGMLSMSHDNTPRNIYDIRHRHRGSTDSYGFPSAHSATSSISSTGFSTYYGGSVDGSISDYSATGSDFEPLAVRTLPKPSGLMSSQPPAPQSMMGSFSSKVSSSTQKKHKCRVCDKRFTRPSSLQTHMYSHTGEKRKFLVPSLVGHRMSC